jgi:hypothetical protein
MQVQTADEDFSVDEFTLNGNIDEDDPLAPLRLVRTNGFYHEHY